MGGEGGERSGGGVLEEALEGHSLEGNLGRRGGSRARSILRRALSLVALGVVSAAAGAAAASAAVQVSERAGLCT